jgi:hypothetical protein
MPEVAKRGFASEMGRVRRRRSRGGGVPDAAPRQLEGVVRTVGGVYGADRQRLNPALPGGAVSKPDARKQLWTAADAWVPHAFFTDARCRYRPASTRMLRLPTSHASTPRTAALAGGATEA